MPHIIATERALWWAVGNPVIETGITPVGALTVSGLPMVSAADENEFLGAVVGTAGDYKPLPEMGEWVEAGDIYGYDGGLVIVRQSHVRQNDPDDDGVGALFGLYRPGVEVWEWVAGEAVEVGARRGYAGVVYELYREIGANNWTPPPQVAAHWRVVQEDEWPEWVQPTGAHDAYNIGDKVTFQGGRYISKINANVWSPAVYPAGWEYQGPA